MVTEEECHNRYAQGNGGYMFVNWTTYRSCFADGTRASRRGTCEYKNVEKGYEGCDAMITREECYKRYGQGDGGYIVANWTTFRTCGD